MNVQFTGDAEPILERLAQGLLDEPAAFALKRAAEALAARLHFDRLLSLDDARIDLYPHQERAVRRVIRDMRGRAILADDVGLGKTVEAGIILKEYMHRGLVACGLILVPPGLLGNWRAELRRLGIEVRDEIGVLDSEGRPRPGVCLLSLGWARGAAGREALQGTSWDMVIVDEAHRLRNAATRSWQLVSSIRTRYLLLLTATPVQNDLKELYTLVTLLRPGQLSTYADFRRRFIVDRHAARDVGRLRELLAQVMVRTARREAFVNFPRRLLTMQRLQGHEEEVRAYEAVLALAREAYVNLDRDDVHLLPYLQLLRQVTSHPAGAAATVGAMAARDTGGWPGTKRLRQVQQALAAVKAPTAKLGALGTWLSLEGGGERVVIFTEFRATQRVIARWLEGQGWRCTLVHGGQTRAEQASALDEFRSGRSPVLISTDAGSEGHNWQIARTVINFDLPWNPMRLEQRIGRVYRLGQMHDVRIVNFVAAGTVDEYVVELLHRKLGMFEQVIGDLDDVLGDDGSVLQRRLAEVILGPDAQRREQQWRELTEAVAAWRREWDQAAALSALLPGVI